MNYENAKDILPPEIINMIQEYTDGKYLYIPRKVENKKSWGEKSGSKKELDERNLEITNLFKEGKSVKEISSQYYLTEHTIRRIIRNTHSL